MAAIVKNKSIVLWGISISLIFPLFIQLSQGIYSAGEPVLDSGGALTNLPLPISIVGCSVGILALRSHYRRAGLSFRMIVAMLLVMLISLFWAGFGKEIEGRKIMLMLQFLLPTIGLVTGQMVIDVDRIVPKAFLYVLILVVPLQLLSGWMQGSLSLTHDLYLFSIYQHFQYVPLIMVSAFAYAAVMLWDSHKKMLYVLTPVMGLYAVASVSFLTIFAFIAFVAVFVGTKLWQADKKIKATSAIMLIIVISVMGMRSYLHLLNNHHSYVGDKGQYAGKFQAITKGETPKNVDDRLADWKLYGNGLVESAKTFLFGHSAPFPRSIKSSAHNWYLDMAYTFGAISLAPTIFLIGYTLYFLWRAKAALTDETLWLGGIVLFLVLIDNNFKVTLRQPYPGIFSYFLWGLLISSVKGSTQSAASRF